MNGIDLYRNISLLSIVRHGVMRMITLLKHVHEDKMIEEFDPKRKLKEEVMLKRFLLVLERRSSIIINRKTYSPLSLVDVWEMDLQNTAFTIQLGRGVSIQLTNAMIIIENTGATIQFGNVDFPIVVVRTTAVPANDANSERHARRLYPVGAPARRAHLPV
ncbi:hypothetical protein IEQ34_012288 [Dendrobium chrysotoxum]|uniref:Uncharacterized protein n=1 Tax=Dendrobium chrysotoxum TaxID=161865 RepID=A0AAV7GUM5_DENCH|nr:hypothetical protein IEQ34_012288 [Dendrobium chrysotoxum]